MAALTALYCIVGCTVERRHGAECDDKGCRGCQPRSADLPHAVCFQCLTRLAQALAKTPDIAAHLSSNIEPGAAPERGDETHTKGASAPAPMNLDAAADADELHAVLASWVLLILEEHPDKLHGPGWDGSDVRPASKRTTSWGAVVYEDPRVVGVRDPQATARLATWLNTHLSWAMQQPWADDMVTQVTRTINVLRGRWPTEEPPKFLPIRCPSCQLRSLRRYAPREQGHPADITCSNPACLRTLPEGHYVRESA